MYVIIAMDAFSSFSFALHTIFTFCGFQFLCYYSPDELIDAIEAQKLMPSGMVHMVGNTGHEPLSFLICHHVLIS